MAKVRYHLAPHGPDVCRADPSNPRSKGCPFGGASGSDNHFDTMAEAESAYESKMEASGNGLVATARTAVSPQSSMQIETISHSLKARYKKELEALVANTYYGVRKEDRTSRYLGDSSEGIERLRTDFVQKFQGEVDPEITYHEDSDDQVIRSIYIAELDLEVENDNIDMDMNEHRDYEKIRAHGDRTWWKTT